MPSPQPNETGLVFTHKHLSELVDEQVGPGTLVIADAYNYPTIQELPQAVQIERPTKAALDAVRAAHPTPRNVLAIGGCSAVDFARSCTPDNGRLVVVPSILSTSCIAVDRSVEYWPNGPRYVHTVAPQSVIVSLPLLARSPAEVVRKWTHSGLADLLSNLSAAIDNNGAETLPDGETLALKVPEVFAAMAWINESYKDLDEQALTRCASLLQQASRRVCIEGSQYSSAGEHELYYALIAQRTEYDRSVQTHGRLVSIGTLLSLTSYSQLTGDRELESRLREAYRRLELPTTLEGLEAIGVLPEHVVFAMGAVATGESFLAEAWTRHGSGLMGETYG